LKHTLQFNAFMVLASILFSTWTAVRSIVAEETPFVPHPVMEVIKEEGLSKKDLRFSPDGRRLWTAALDCWDVSTGQKVDTAKMKLAADQEANDGPASMDLSADGSTLLAINTKSGVIRLWSVNSQQIMRQITVARRDGRMFPTGNVRFLDNHTFGAWCPTSQAIFRGRTDTSEKDMARSNSFATAYVLSEVQEFGSTAAKEYTTEEFWIVGHIGQLFVREL